MDRLRLAMDAAWSFLASTELFLGVLWAGLAAISITLLVLMRTRWGQSEPLRKCFVLSLLAHLLFAGYATTVQICSTGPQTSGESTMLAALVDRDASSPQESPRAPAETPEEPWEEFVHEDVAQPDVAEPSPEEIPPAPEPPPEPAAIRDAADEEDAARLAALGPSEPQSDDANLEPVVPHPALARQPEPLEAPQAERREPTAAVAPTLPPENQGDPAPSPSNAPPPRVAEETVTDEPGEMLRDVADLAGGAPRTKPAEVTPEPTTAGQPAAAEESAGPSVPAGVAAAESAPSPATRDPRPQPAARVPEIYSLRRSPDRASEAQRRGATEQSEKAVREGLAWLAANQEPDGRWDASRHGAGRETFLAGQNRNGAGIDADTGMTGLALLAFLAAGNTQEQGEYRQNVRRGLDFLLASQRSDGYMAGGATSFAAMYCHAMATLAMSEAYAMTGDARLGAALRSAVRYTLAAQDPRGGGWRYVPGDAGDTSQLGWQVMALRSAELAGVSIPAASRDGMLRFFSSVSSGRHSGLGSYRPGQKPSKTMTAEALYCRQLLGMPPESPTAGEAADYLLAELPGNSSENLYYWYYATLGLYQVQGDAWQRWNDAMQKDLVARQCGSGSLAGSWDPDGAWGSYGGRVYSTALATLCLEVYYRYLPLYTQTAAKQTTTR